MHDEVGGCVEILQLFFTMMGHQQVLIKFKETRKGFFMPGETGSKLMHSTRDLSHEISWSEL